MYWHEHLKRAVKVAVVGGLHYTGVLSLMRRAYVRNRGAILLYHRVLPRGHGVPDYSPNGMTVTPVEFAMQMRFLKRNYHVVPLSQIAAEVRSTQPALSGLCAVTFDDGWLDVYEHAFPVLQALSLPATLFLTTGYVGGSEWSWEERVRYLLARIHHRRKRIGSEPGLRNLHDRLRGSMFAELFRVSTAAFPHYLLRTIPELKKWSAAERRDAMIFLEEAAPLADPEHVRPFLTWSQVRAMAQSGVELGNHSMRHRVLPELSDEEIVEEISGANAEIERESGYRPANLAYPYGKTGPRVQDLVRRGGFASGCTTKIGPVEAGANVYALNRINISSETTFLEPLFAGRLLCL
ncbi:MAG: polysaccharide deacetylase family protein [Steroidobacteraceae bacterium]